MNNQNLKETSRKGHEYVPVARDWANGLEDRTFDDDVDKYCAVELWPEMENLAKAVYRYSKTTAPQLLGHVVVKVFLDLKWIKLKWPIYFLTLFYVSL